MHEYIRGGGCLGVVMHEYKSAGPRVSCTNIFVRTSKFVGTGSEPDETFRVGKALLVEMKNCASAVFQIDNTKVNERKSIMYVSTFASIIFIYSFILHFICHFD